jgi:hypothetical protein
MNIGVEDGAAASAVELALKENSPDAGWGSGAATIDILMDGCGVSR